MYLKDNKSMNVLKIRHFCNFIGKILMDFMIYTDAGNRGQSSLCHTMLDLVTVHLVLFKSERDEKRQKIVNIYHQVYSL